MTCWTTWVGLLKRTLVSGLLHAHHSGMGCLLALPEGASPELVMAGNPLTIRAGVLEPRRFERASTMHAHAFSRSFLLNHSDVRVGCAANPGLVSHSHSVSLQ